jgi:3-hydroxyisobutyrate dehydrogenase-like beta-hydroxyacid dehydrogenase
VFSLANSFKDVDYYNTMCADIGAKRDVAQTVQALYKEQVDAGNAEKYVPELITLLNKG